MMALVLVTVGCRWARSEPTVVNSVLTFDDYTDPDKIGFWVYYANDGQIRTYGDGFKFDAGPTNDERVLIKDYLPAIKGSMCFQLTAYDAVSNESEYSNEACGWFGISKANNAKTE